MSKWNTLQAVAALLTAACIIIFVEFFTCVLVFDENRPSFGISRDNATKIGLVYGPLLVVTFSGLRDALSAMLIGFDNDKIRWLFFSSRYATVWSYTLACAGALAPIISIVLISRHELQVSPEWIIGISAGIWSLTSGDVFNKYLKRFSLAPPRAPADISPETSETKKAS